MNTKQLQYVQTLARIGSFSGAAAELGISQPSLSQYVKKIEQELGTPLFRRTGNELSLTAAGEVYLEAGRRMLDEEAQMHARLGDLKADRRGVLRIGAAPFRTSSLLPRAIAAFRERFPGFCVRVTEATTVELTEGAERGEFDLCLLPLPADERLFVCERVTEERLGIAVPASFPVPDALRDYDGKPVPFSAFRGLPFVSVGEEQVLGRALAGLAADAGEELIRAAVCVNVDSCLAMVEAGVGAALLPLYLTAGKPSLRTYRLAGDADVREIAVLYRRGAYVSEPMKAMIGILKQLPAAHL